MKKVVHAVCPHDCPDACGTLITIEDGRATRIQGDPEHPITRGFLCAKVAKYLDRVYSPERVLHPFKRIAPKGVGGFAAFQEISWDDAFSEIVGKLKAISEEFGPEAILPYSYGGTLAVLNSGSMDRRFFHRLGASQLHRSICATTGGDAIVSMYGRKMGTEPEQFRESKLILAWGANIHGNNVHLWPFITEARRKGAKLVVIDPYRTRTASLADWHIAINPGTDVALALGMLHVIVRDGLQDDDYIRRHAEGYEALLDRLPRYTPEQVSRWTGVSASDIEKLARDYATTRPAVIRLNYGVQRSQNGGAAVRAVCMLPVITGSWKEVGGGLQLSTSGAYQLDRDELELPELMWKSPLGRAARVINMVQLGRVLNETDDPPVKALFVYGSNPAAVCPDHNAVVRGLKRTDLFTVVHEQFLTDTADYADLVLPATTFFEYKDLVTSYGHYYLQLSQQALEPEGECISNVELFRQLGLRMGFEDACFRESVDKMIDRALSAGVPQLAGITRKRLETEWRARLNFEGAGNAHEPYLPFAHGFPTPSGKARLYDESLIELGMDPVAEFVPPSESRHADHAQRFPLELLARKADNFLNSTFANIPSLQELERRHELEISHADAQARGILDGDRVRVFNQRGEIYLRARVDGTVGRGVVGARLDWAKSASGSVNINVLTSSKLADMGGGATFYSTLVEVERARETSSGSLG